MTAPMPDGQIAGKHEGLGPLQPGRSIQPVSLTLPWLIKEHYPISYPASEP
jgi:hypothetical protein